MQTRVQAEARDRNIDSLASHTTLLTEASLLLRFAAELVVLLVAARTFGRAFAYFGQPPVVGELLSGIVLGSSLFGGLLPEASRVLVAPGDTGHGRLLEVFCLVSMVCILMLAGAETDLRAARRLGKAVACTTACSVLVSLSAGATVGYLFSDSPELNAVPGNPSAFVAFSALILGISSVPVITRVLLDLGLTRNTVGVVVLSSAMVTEVIVWILVGSVSGLVEGDSELTGLMASILASSFFLVSAFLFGRPITRSLASLAGHVTTGHALSVTPVAVAAIFAGITQVIGLHAALGAFVGGLLVRDLLGGDACETRRLKGMVTGLLAPIFFAASGLRVELGSLLDPTVFLAGAGIIVAASIGKLLGGTMGARLGKLPLQQAIAIGSGLNSRGSQELMIATLALSLGVITEQFYSVVVVMAVVSCMFSSALLGRATDTTGPKRRTTRDAEPSATTTQVSLANTQLLDGRDTGSQTSIFLGMPHITIQKTIR